MTSHHKKLIKNNILLSLLPLEPLPQDRVVSGLAYGCLGGLDAGEISEIGWYLYLLAALVAADLDLLVVLPGYPLPYGQRVLHLPAVYQVDAVAQVPDLILPGGGVYGLDFAHLPVGHADDAVGEGLKRDIVRHHNHRDFLVDVQVDKNLHNYIGAAGVQVPGRLVEQEDGRVVRDGTRDGDALLLTARELVREVVETAAQAHLF